MRSKRLSRMINEEKWDSLPTEIKTCYEILMKYVKNDDYPQPYESSIERICAVILGEIREKEFDVLFRIVGEPSKDWKDRFKSVEISGFHYPPKYCDLLDHIEWMRPKFFTNGWVNDKAGSTLLFSHPYEPLNFYLLRDFCDEFNLHCEISASSKHFPGKTFLLVFSLKEDKI